MGLRAMLLPIAIAAGLGLVAAQDVYSCPDGWQKEEDRSGCRCFLIAETEALTRSTADLVCAGHSGAWVAELDHPGINYWLKSRPLKPFHRDSTLPSGLEDAPRGDTAN